MHTSALIIAALSAATAYAKPIAQNGRWLPEWESKSNANAVVSGPASSAPVVTATSAAGPVAGSATMLGVPAASPNPGPNKELSASLLTAALASDRFTLLKAAADAGTTDFKFDLNPDANNITAGEGGLVVLANRGNFPVLTDLGTAFAGLFFEPCGLNTPHIHPRATEVLTLVTPGEMLAGFILDNTFNMEINETLTQFQGMAFPQGSIHFQMNNECEPAVAIAGFSDEDPSASSIANRFFSFSPDVVLPTLGFPSQITPDNFAQFVAGIPPPFAKGIQQCYAKCGISPK